MIRQPGSAFPRRAVGWMALAVLMAGVAPARAGRKICIVKSKDLPPFERAAQNFKKCLADKGVDASFQEVILPDSPAESEMTFRAVAAGKPDLMLTLGAQASRLSREKLPGVPSVFCMVLDPLSNGLDKAGVSMDPRPADYLEYIRRHFPQFKRVGVLYNPRQSKGIVQELRKAAPEPGALVLVEVNELAGLDKALQSLKTKADCLLMIMDSTIYTPQTSSQIILQTIQMDLPFIALSAPFVRGGALAALYADWGDNGCQAAELADRVLKGEDADALPLLSPRKLDSAVNLIVADRLKVSVSAAARADAEQLVQ